MEPQKPKNKKAGKSKRGKRIIKRILLFLLVIVLLGGIGVFAYARLQQEYTTTYQEYTATTGTISNSLSFSGTLQVIKDLGLKEPYVGQVDLQTGEIGDDLTYYFATSEQVPSAVGLGVLMNKDNTVRQAGGFILQVMPFAEEQTISRLEENVGKIHSVTALLDKGLTPEELLKTVLEGFDLEFNDTIDTEFYCNCSKERVEKALISIGRKDLNEMIQEGKPVELNCHFCNTNYTFSVEELKQILKRCK